MEKYIVYETKQYLTQRKLHNPIIEINRRVQECKERAGEDFKAYGPQNPQQVAKYRLDVIKEITPILQQTKFNRSKWNHYKANVRFVDKTVKTIAYGNELNENRPLPQIPRNNERRVQTPRKKGFKKQKSRSKRSRRKREIEKRELIELGRQQYEGLTKEEIKARRKERKKIKIKEKKKQNLINKLQQEN